MLWVEGHLSTLERLSITSFLHHGYDVHLYVYRDVSGIPAGTRVLDGRSVLPEKAICYYGPGAGDGAGSVALFSNLFRYQLLMQGGGIWSDTDVICLRSLDSVLNRDYLFASEHVDRSHERHLVNNCFMKVPASSPFIQECVSVSQDVDPSQVKWGELGPGLVTAMTTKHSLQGYVTVPAVFSPIDYWDIHRLLQSGAPAMNQETLAVHCFNEIWRRLKIDKDGDYPASALIERLKTRYLILAAVEKDGHNAAGTPTAIATARP
jgi:hypothetical protein